MALAPCPACGLPRAAADADSPCPACRWADGAPPAPEPAPPPPTLAPVPEPPRARTRPVALVGAAVGVCATLIVQQFLPRPEPAPEPVPAPETAAAPPVYPRIPSLPVAPPPRAVEPDDDDPVVVPIPIPVAAGGGFATLKLDQPDDLIHFPKLGPGNKVRLTGRVKKLYVEGLDGGAELDATGLANDGLSVTGPLDGGAVLRAKTDGGTASFKDGIRGGAVVELDAPKASVTFYGPTGKGKATAGVGSGARVTVRAKAVVVNAPVTGDGTVLDVTFSRGGSLKLNAVESGALVRYRSEHRADPPIKLTPGRISGGELREEPPP